MRKYNSLPQYMKNNLLIVTIFIVTLLGLSVGYSVLTKDININSGIIIRGETNVRVTDVSNMNSVNGAYEVNNASYNVSSILYSYGLPKLDSTISYDSSITNVSSMAYYIKSLSITQGNNSNMTFEINNIATNTIIMPGETLDFNVLFRYKSSVTTVPENTECESMIEFVFDIYEQSQEEYATNNMLLDLRGYDAPVDNKWIDRVGNNEVALNNVVHDNELNLYDFSSGGYGEMTKSFIPETEDFTAEVLIKLPEKLTNNDDQAILSQINNTSNSNGRFKFNYVNKSNVPSLLIFANETAKNTNSFYYFAYNVEASANYLLQITRTNDMLTIYVNGSKITSYNFDSENLISQNNLKLGKWNNSTPQSFKGDIYAVRIYNRALSDDELINNYNVDEKKYFDVKETYSNIKEYAINHYLASAGPGLYQDNSNYVFKGELVNNYVKFPENNNLYRIISFEDNDTMKLINTSVAINEPFDRSGYRDPNVDKYCTYAHNVADKTTGEFSGCNAFSANGTTVFNNSSSSDYLNNTYYSTLSDEEKERIIKHDFDCGIVKDNISANDAILAASASKCNLNVGTISLTDVLKSSLSITTLKTDVTLSSSFLTSLETDTIGTWTMNGLAKNTFDVWMLLYNKGVTLAGRRASRYSQLVNNIDEKFEIYPVIYVSSDLAVTGNGSINKPFIVSD